MTDLWKPLVCWGPIQRERLILAKQALWLDYKVVPRPLEAPTAFERVLAWGTPPPVLCEYALVIDESTDQEIEDALAWVLEEEGPDVGMTYRDVLGYLMGPGVREIPAAEIEAEAKAAAYNRGDA